MICPRPSQSGTYHFLTRKLPGPNLPTTPLPPQERKSFGLLRKNPLMVCITNPGWLFTHSSAFHICRTVVLATIASTSLFVNLLTARTDGLSFCFLLPPLPLELLLLLLLLLKEEERQVTPIHRYDSNSRLLRRRPLRPPRQQRQWIQLKMRTSCRARLNDGEHVPSSEAFMRPPHRDTAAVPLPTQHCELCSFPLLAIRTIPRPCSPS